MFEEEQSALLDLLQAHLHAELDVHQRRPQLLLDLLLGHLAVVEDLLKLAERPAHGAHDQHHRLVLFEFLHSLIPLQLVVEVPRHAVVRVIDGQVEGPAVPQPHLPRGLRHSRRGVDFRHVMAAALE